MAHSGARSKDAEHQALLEEALELDKQFHLRLASTVGPMPFPADLTMRQFHLLQTVAPAAGEGLTFQQLVQALDISSPTLTGLVDRMADKALIEKFSDPHDRRVRRVRIAPEGLDAIMQMTTAIGNAVAEVLNRFDPRELRAFRDNAELMVRALERTRSQAERAAPGLPKKPH